MSDVNANIGVNIDTSNALAQLKALQRQISQFHTSVAKSSEAAALAQKSLQRNLLNSVNAIGAFSAELRNVKTTAESFTSSLEGNKFSMREYFRYAGASTKTFGKLFKSEFDTIGKVAEERVKTLQTQYIKLGRDTSGAMKAMAITPTQLDLSNYSTQTQIAAQKQALFNQLMKQGSTNLLNFGKNTQWAGRQLMVGFTIPLVSFGSIASKTFMDLEAQALKFKKVYGDLGTTQAETNTQLANIKELGKQYTQYGVALSQTVGLAADAAAAGFQGVDLQRQTAAATRLSVLGQIDNQQALQTTISLQNAFNTSSADLASNIDFLNAVENQTVTSLDDITTAIPKVAPVIKQLGGNVKDLAFFLTAMKEGGVNASEGANALKSGLASLINPTKKASDMFMSYGINIKDIVYKNQGNLKQTVIEFAQALDKLAPLDRAKAIEQLFGKFQFARISTLLQNVTKDGTQAARVLDLTNASVADLAALSQKELGVTANSAMNKFKKAIEDLKISLVPVGETFLKAVTPIIDFAKSVLDKFNNLSDGAKKFITLLTVGVGAIGPIVLMTFGLLANGVANIIKLFLTLRNGYLRLTGQSKILGEQTQYLTTEQLSAAAAAHSLDQSHATLTQTFNVEKTALEQLTQAYMAAARAGATFAMNNPGMMLPPRGRGRGYAQGGEVLRVPGSGNGDTVPAMLTPGETVIPKQMSKKYAKLINAMIAGNIPGYQFGKGFRNATMYLPESVNTLMGSVTGRGAGTADVTSYIRKSGSAGMAPLMAVMAREMGLKLNDPKFKAEWAKVGDKFAKAAADALDNSGKTFIKDLDLEQIVVPALKEAAQGINVGGKEIGASLDNAINQIRTVGPVGVESGSKKGAGRTALLGSYRTARTSAQQFAAAENPEMFQQTTRFSQSKNKDIKSFKTLNLATKEWEVATMSHITQSVTGTTEALIKEVTPYLGDQTEKITKAVVKSETAGAVKGLKQVAKIASPSREMENAGKALGQGAILGLESYQDDAKIAGETLGAAATGGLINPKTGKPFTQAERGRTTLPIVAAGVPMSRQTEESGNKQLEKIKTMNDRLDGINRAIMGGTFALTTLSAVGSMASGTLGDVSAQVSKYSGLLFGLMSITQLLTQTKIAELAIERVNLAKNTVRAASIAAGGSLGMLSRIGIFAARLFSLTNPIGWVIAGLTTTFGIIKLVNAARERERKSIEALGNAAYMSADKLKNIGSFFGVSPTTSKIQTTKPMVPGVTTQQKTQIEQLIADKNFQKDQKDTIKTLTKASSAQAQIIFKSIAMQMRGAGFAPDMIQTFVDALRVEAKKTDIKFDVKSISLGTAEGQAGLVKSIQTLSTSLGKEFVKGYSTETFRTVDKYTGKWTTIVTENMSKGLKKNLVFASKSIAATLDGLSGQLENGTINAQQFNQSFDAISKTISGMPSPQALILMNSVLNNLDSPLAKAAKGIKNVKDQMLIAKAAALGLETVTPAMIKTLAAAATSADGATQRAANRVRAKINSDIAPVTAAIAEVAKAATAAVDNGTASNKKQVKTLADLIIENKANIQTIQDQTDATKKLTKAGFSAEEALKLVANAEDAAAISGIKVKYTKAQWEEYVKTLKKARAALLGTTEGAKQAIDDATSAAQAYFSAQETLIRTSRQSGAADIQKQIDSQQQLVDKYQAKIDIEQKSIDNNSHLIDLYNRQIDINYDRPIKALNDESTILQNNLTLINHQEQAINDKYDAQAKALQQVSTINQQLINQEKSRLNIAGALTQGDIAAAAQAAQDARAQAASDQTQSAQNALDAARAAELASVTAGGMTKTQIEERLYQIGQQTFALEQQKKTIQDQILILQDQNWQYEQKIYEIKTNQLTPAQESLNKATLALETYNKQTDSLIAQVTYLGLTQQEWDANKAKADAAYVSIKATETSLNNAHTAAKNLFNQWQQIKSKTITITTQYISKSGPSFGFASGGMVPQYFGDGGSPIGSDTVPAMLTPGEFVVNRAATQKNKSLLKAINSGNVSGLGIKNSLSTPSFDGASSGNMVTNMPVTSVSTSVNNNSNSVYNYSVGINVGGSNVNAESIAKSVIDEIKYIDSQRLRGQK